MSSFQAKCSGYRKEGASMYDGLIEELTWLMDLSEGEIMQLEDILEGDE